MTVLAVHGLFPTHTGDVTQLVNSRYCVLCLCVLAASHVVITSVYYGQSIHCHCPRVVGSCSTFTAACLSSTTDAYKHDLSSENFNKDEAPRITTYRYYNFITLILLLQAALFYCPSVIWRELSRKVGILPDELALSAVEARRTKDASDRDLAVQDIASHIRKFCIRQLRRRHWSYAFRWYHGSKLCYANVFSKACYAASVIGQFYMLDSFLGMPFHLLGWQIIERQAVVVDLVSGIFSSIGYPFLLDNEVSNITSTLSQNGPQNVSIVSIEFPTDIICGVQRRVAGYINTMYIGCHLSVNPLNELIFSYVWFLMLLAVTVTMTTLALSLFQIFLFPCRRMHIRERLQDTGAISRDDPEVADSVVKAFEKHFLQRDGLFLLSYVEAGGGDVLADETLVELWTYFEETPDLREITKPIQWKEQVDVKIDKIDDDNEAIRCGSSDNNDTSTSMFIPMTPHDTDRQLYQLDIPPAYDNLKTADV